MCAAVWKVELKDANRVATVIRKHNAMQMNAAYASSRTAIRQAAAHQGVRACIHAVSSATYRLRPDYSAMVIRTL